MMGEEECILQKRDNFLFSSFLFKIIIYFYYLLYSIIISMGLQDFFLSGFYNSFSFVRVLHIIIYFIKPIIFIFSDDKFFLRKIFAQNSDIIANLKSSTCQYLKCAFIKIMTILSLV